MILKEKIDKNSLRAFALNKRNVLGKIGMIEKISKSITKKILSSDYYKKANDIALYYPIKNEIDITSILTKEKNFYFPKCINNELYFCKVDSLNNLERGAFNIPEPKGNIINPKILDLIYIPALLANKKSYRLGYGKGFYDRFFKSNNIKAKKIIVVPFAFISDDFQEDEFDFQCDEVLSETMLNIC